MKKTLLAIVVLVLLTFEIKTSIATGGFSYDSGIKDTGYHNALDVYISRTDGKYLDQSQYNLTVKEYRNNILVYISTNQTMVFFVAGVSKYRVLITSSYNLQVSSQLSIGSIRNASVSTASSKNTPSFGLPVFLCSSIILISVKKSHTKK